MTLLVFWQQVTLFIFGWGGVNLESISSVEEKDREERREDLAAAEEEEKVNETEIKTVGEKGTEKIMALGRFREGQ